MNKNFLRVVALIVALATDQLLAEKSVNLDQGPNWTELSRRQFYGVDQGSKLIPFSWIKALSLPGGISFLGDGLTRYGYLSNPANTNKLPVGFTVTRDGWLGLSCAACHTREIVVGGTAYRVDGGPALADLQSFLSDLDQAVDATLSDDALFRQTAERILGVIPSPQQLAALKKAVSDWYTPFNAQMTRSLPNPPWGHGRIDAVSMIFNRLAGLDISPTPNGILTENMVMADAPARYPYLWNAAYQDRTQWTGFAENGDALLSLFRNQGEVIGVFLEFHPQKNGSKIDYSTVNSTNFDGLGKANGLMRQIGSPKWPWGVDANLAARGQVIYNENCSVGCHEIKQGQFRILNPLGPSWATPILNVGTDTREYNVLARQVNTGVLAGASIPFLHELGATDSAFNVLRQAIYGSLISSNDWLKGVGAGLSLASKVQSLLAVGSGWTAPASNPNAYEARVHQGIWAAAPYLHNGTVPTLAELLKPAKDRVSSFRIGPHYDIVNIGLAVEQDPAREMIETTDCNHLNSGNSRCGHEFGTNLPDSDKKALLEYLKTL